MTMFTNERSYRDFTQDMWGGDETAENFLVRFQRENGRPPRILNIGNIANNGFKNASILRKNGVDCDVICYDYYHVMGCPEWELAIFSTEGVNFNKPVWRDMELGGYERPRWFAQGRLATCLDYLLAERAGSPNADRLWQCLAQERDSGGGMFPDSSAPSAYDPDLVNVESERLAALFETVFPGRAAKPTATAIAGFIGGLLIEKERLQRLFAHYDLVVGYATDGLLPLIAQKTPYACFEHGTIRTFPFDDSLFGQMCALSYACASDVLISNCDNIVAARRLCLRSFRFLPHAMLEDFREDPVAAALREELLTRHDADFLVFHPSRQHWSTVEDLNWEKGNDRLICGFAHFVRRERPKALLIMVDWGQTVSASKALVEDLGIGDRVIWVQPQPLPVVGRYVAAADVLADQFVIGAWGAIMPHGMMLGTPTMLFLNEALHEWCFPVMPPVLNTRTADEIHAGFVKATDPDYRARIKAEGIAWYNRYHSESVVARRLLDCLIETLNPSEAELILRGQRDIQATLVSMRNQQIRDTHSTVSAALSRRLQAFGSYIIGSRLTSRIATFLRDMKGNSPFWGGILFYMTYWPARALIRVGRKVVVAFKR